MFALSHPHHGAELEGLIQGEFADEGALERALALVQAAGGMLAARSLARQEADMVRPRSRVSGLHVCVAAPRHGAYRGAGR